MGILGTRWEAEYEGHKLAINRNELTKGFNIEWDGEEVAKRKWSLIGLGELHGSVEAKGKPVDVKVVIHWGGLSELDGVCVVTVDGVEIPVKHVK